MEVKNDKGVSADTPMDQSYELFSFFFNDGPVISS